LFQIATRWFGAEPEIKNAFVCLWSHWLSGRRKKRLWMRFRLWALWRRA
jgi:hypothetical protein